MATVPYLRKRGIAILMQHHQLTLVCFIHSTVAFNINHVLLHIECYFLNLFAALLSPLSTYYFLMFKWRISPFDPGAVYVCDDEHYLFKMSQTNARASSRHDRSACGQHFHLVFGKGHFIENVHTLRVGRFRCPEQSEVFNFATYYKRYSAWMSP